LFIWRFSKRLGCIFCNFRISTLSNRLYNSRNRSLLLIHNFLLLFLMWFINSRNRSFLITLLPWNFFIAIKIVLVFYKFFSIFDFKKLYLISKFIFIVFSIISLILNTFFLRKLLLLSHINIIIINIILSYCINVLIFYFYEIICVIIIILYLWILSFYIFLIIL